MYSYRIPALTTVDMRMLTTTNPDLSRSGCYRRISITVTPEPATSCGGALDCDVLVMSPKVVRKRFPQPGTACGPYGGLIRQHSGSCASDVNTNRVISSYSRSIQVHFDVT